MSECRMDMELGATTGRFIALFSDHDCYQIGLLSQRKSCVAKITHVLILIKPTTIS